MNKVEIRKYQASDFESVYSLFYQTVHEVNCKDYSDNQIKAWAPEIPINEERWQKSLLKNHTLVAVLNEQIVGFCDIEDSGHLDRFYVSHQHQRMGIARTLMDEINLYCTTKGINRVYSEVSITALPFFKSSGFKIINEQKVERFDEIFVNYIMEKYIK